MPEKCCWKNEAFNYVASFALVSALILCLFIWDRVSREYPPPQTYRLEIVYPPTSVNHLLDVRKMVGKRSEPGKLSPEMEKAEHWRMVLGILDGKTTQAVIDGPPGLDAPWRREK